jgi:hypothetical protein
VITALLVLLRVAGVGLLVLAASHVPIARYLRWKEEASRLSPANEAVFHVHTLFICVVLLLMGVPALVAPQLFVERSLAGLWLTWLLALFWALRLIVQWFVFPSALWRGKRLETAMHVLFSITWIALTALFAACGLVQSGHLG